MPIIYFVPATPLNLKDFFSQSMNKVFLNRNKNIPEYPGIFFAFSVFALRRKKLTLPLPGLIMQRSII